MNWDDGIEGPHRAIAASASSRIGVLAGPGTGKTSYGLMRRVVRLLAEGVPGGRILLISFTRTAAQDLREKIAALGVFGADEVRATTLHSYCFGLLQRDSVLAITGRQPRPMMKHEIDLMLRDLEGDFGNIYARRELVEAFEAGWARGITDHPGLAVDPSDRQFESQVMRWMIHHRAILIGEVVPLAFDYLRNNPMAEDLGNFSHVIVDEYQDLNVLEQHLLDLLAEGETSLCIAGDDDQSIYSFRHANPIGIQQFLDRDDVERHEIEVCGRCPRRILSMANSLISHASDRDKPVMTCRQENVEGSVAVVQWPDLSDEVEGIVAAIVADIEQDRRQPGDILVLTSRHKIGEAVRDGLRTLEIDAHSFFSEEAVRTVRAQEALALLWLAVSDDPVSLRVILGLDDGDGRANAYRKLMAYCWQEGISEQEALGRASRGDKLPVSIRAFLPRYIHACNVIDGLTLEDLPSVIEALFPDNQEELADLRALAVDLLPDVESARSLLDALIVRITQVDVPASPDYVRIMSLHKSKGLTSPVVYVAGMAEGIVPTLPKNGTDDQVSAAVEEQRRLFYVAITRAADQLVLSYAASMELSLAMKLQVRLDMSKIRRIGGEKRIPTIASRYLRELGTDAPRSVPGARWLQDHLGSQ
jgi:superfamily I DNA/RNA helicase